MMVAWPYNIIFKTLLLRSIMSKAIIGSHFANCFNASRQIAMPTCTLGSEPGFSMTIVSHYYFLAKLSLLNLDLGSVILSQLVVPLKTFYSVKLYRVMACQKI